MVRTQFLFSQRTISSSGNESSHLICLKNPFDSIGSPKKATLRVAVSDSHKKKSKVLSVWIRKQIQKDRIHDVEVLFLDAEATVADLYFIFDASDAIKVAA